MSAGGTHFPGRKNRSVSPAPSVLNPGCTSKKSNTGSVNKTRIPGSFTPRRRYERENCGRLLNSIFALLNQLEILSHAPLGRSEKRGIGGPSERKSATVVREVLLFLP